MRNDAILQICTEMTPKPEIKPKVMILWILADLTYEYDRFVIRYSRILTAEAYPKYTLFLKIGRVECTLIVRKKLPCRRMW